MEKKVYSWLAILVSSVIGGPLGGVYMLGENFKVMGKKDSARKTFIIGAASVIAISIALILTPENIVEQIPNYLLTAVAAGVLAGLAKKHQEKGIKDILSSGGKKQSVWKIAAITVLFTLIMLAFVLAVSAIMP
jgi:hypothetical protein